MSEYAARFRVTDNGLELIESTGDLSELNRDDLADVYTCRDGDILTVFLDPLGHTLYEVQTAGHSTVEYRCKHCGERHATKQRFSDKCDANGDGRGDTS